MAQPPANPGQGRADLLRLWRLVAGQRSWMLGGAAVALLALLANVGLLALSGWFIATMALAGAAGAVIDYFTPAALIRALAIARTAGRYGERLLTHEATLRILSRLRVWLYLAIEPLAPGHLDVSRSADWLSRLQADIDTLDQAYLRLLLPAGVALLALTGMLAALAWFSPWLALLSAGWLLLAGVAVPWRAWRRGRVPAAQALELRNRLRIDAGDALAGALELRLFGAEARWLERVDQGSGELLRQQRRLSDLAGLSGAAVGLCANLATGCALLLVGGAVASARMPAQQLPMLMLWVLGSFEAIAPLAPAYALLAEVLAAARRVFGLADTPPPVAEPRHPRELGVARDLSIRGLGMRYASQQAWVLDGLDLELPAGSRLALVGASGAGKSSLLQVLTRLREYQRGSVTLGGEELRDLRGDDVRSLFAVVGQQDYLFHGSVLDNLLLANPQADARQVQAACRAARLHEDILGFPDGYLTQLGEGGTLLSGGQARRLAVARALLKDAPLLLLDEPAEALDEATQRELYEALAQAMRGRTVLLITHRLGALAALVDEVAWLEQGRIAWRGPVAEWERAPGGA